VSLTKIVRQIGLTPEQIFDHKPTWEELRYRHIRDDVKNQYGFKSDMMTYLFLVDEEMRMCTTTPDMKF